MQSNAADISSRPSSVTSAVSGCQRIGLVGDFNSHLQSWLETLTAIIQTGDIRRLI